MPQRLRRRDRGRGSDRTDRRDRTEQKIQPDTDRQMTAETGLPTVHPRPGSRHALSMKSLVVSAPADGPMRIVLPSPRDNRRTHCPPTRLPAYLSTSPPSCLVGALAAHRVASQDQHSRARCPVVTQSHCMVV
jgi:hypothetical protein